MLEADDENRFRDHVESLGCLCLKLLPVSMAGLPDRIIIGARRFILFMELKKKKRGVVSKIQNWVHGQLRKYGFDVEVAFGYKEAIDKFDGHYAAHLKKEGLL